MIYLAGHCIWNVITKQSRQKCPRLHLSLSARWVLNSCNASFVRCLFEEGLVDNCVAKVFALEIGSVTRLGDLLDFGQLFKAFGNNWFTEVSHDLRQFL